MLVPDSAAGLRAEVTRDGADAVATLLTIGRDGREHHLATWPCPDAGSDVEVARGPSAARVAVRVGDVVWTYDVDTGQLVGEHRAPPDAARELFDWGTPILVWNLDGVARLHRPRPASTLDAVLAPGVRIMIDGPVESDGGEATSGRSGAMLFFEPGTPDAERAAVFTEHGARAQRVVAAPVRQRVVVAMAPHHVVVHDASSPLDDGICQVQWPPVVGPHGVLLRRTDVRGTGSHPGAGSGYAHRDQEVLHPWLVAPDGTVRTLPFELGNGPLDVLADGRFLLPCWAPMWWDGGDEPLTALAEDGDTEPLRLHGEPLTPSGVVRAVDPALVADGPRDTYDAGEWNVTSARCEAAELHLALASDEPDRWLLAAVPVDGTTCGPPRRIAGGTTPAGTTVHLLA